MDYSPILISLKTACVSILITVVLGIMAAWMVYRAQNEKVQIVLDSLFTLPMILPPTVVGFFLLLVFGVKGPVGKFLLDFFGYKIAFQWPATVLAATVISFPLMYRNAKGAFDQVDRNLLDCARTLGMSETTILWKVLIANAIPGLVSGSILSFARGLGEFGATSMIAGNIAGKTRTLPVAVYTEVAAGNMDKAMVYVACIVFAAFVAVAILDYMSIRKERRWR
ncbi:MAG: molybdate ABC transporter permease subunit [Erysipelotrichaceae bacterium]|nr:molybdate ABC transporter permease subunit [Erysipelotrichaceae bacterium]